MIEEPPWISDLPRNYLMRPPGNRLPSMAESMPGATSYSARRVKCLAMRKRCGLCGRPVDGVAWQNAYEQPPAQPSHIRWPGDFYTTQFAPYHFSCALFSAMQCPFLRYRGSVNRRHADRAITRGVAQVAGFRHYGLPLDGPWIEHYSDSWLGPPPIAYWGAAQTIEYETWKELIPLYEQAVEDDAETIVVDDACYWEVGDNLNLERCYRRDQLQMGTNGLRSWVPLGGVLRNIYVIQ